jgi:hypothetical protein
MGWGERFLKTITLEEEVEWAPNSTGVGIVGST